MKDILLRHYLYPLKEIHYFFSYPIINWVINPKKPRDPKEPKGVIVLVECWFQKNDYHKLWQGFLEKKGFRTYLLSYTKMNEEFEVTAEKLCRDIKKLKIENFTLVGISTGSLVCLEYLDEHNAWNKIKLFICVAGPLHGSLLARLISFTKKGRDMIPNSSYIKRLHLKSFPKNKMITLSASHDEFVSLKSSRWKDVPSYVIPVYGHNLFHLDHKKTYDLIAQLAEGR